MYANMLSTSEPLAVIVNESVSSILKASMTLNRIAEVNV